MAVRVEAEAAASRVDELVERFRRGPAEDLPAGWKEWPEVVEAHRRLADAFIAAIPPYPRGRYAGRGVVICGGGRTYFPNAWVCVRMLRRLGCDLPVQLWHLGAREMDDRMTELAGALGVECVDAEAMRGDHPARILNGWELKCYALVHCRFEEVLLLDADNVPVSDPNALFDTEAYRRAGAVFWPDFGRLEPDRPIWDVCGVAYRDEPEFESGQIVLDKRRCWAPLQLTMHYNEYSDFYYHYVHGDKETFHMAFRRLGAAYAMPELPILALDGCMCQHDFEGRRIFQHRNMDKWQLDGSNRSIFGFEREDLCREFLAELRSLWSGAPYRNAAPNGREAEAAARLAGRRFLYRRIGYDEREITLDPGGRVGRGSKGCERFWSVNEIDGRPVLSILGDHGVTCHLKHDWGAWRGRWLAHERMPVELLELPDPTAGDGSMRVLAAVASFGPGRGDLLAAVVGALAATPGTVGAVGRVDVVVHSDQEKAVPDGARLVVGLPTGNPHSLPFAHKTLFAEGVNHYDLFIYTEDDVLIRPGNVAAFLEATAVLPEGEVAGLFRYEVGAEGGLHFTEAHPPYHWVEGSARSAGDFVFATFSNMHSGCYVLTRSQLARAIASGGYLVPPHQGGGYDMRESAATDPYRHCGLTKRVCVSAFERFLVHHLPNNYVGTLGMSGEEFGPEIRRLAGQAGGGEPS